jgi:hypothetical protein
MTTAALKRRLLALEAAQDRAEDPERKREVVTLFRAILDAVQEQEPTRNEADEAKAMYLRFRDGVETDRDRAIIASLPACRFDPLEFLRELVERGIF